MNKKFIIFGGVVSLLIVLALVGALMLRNSVGERKTATESTSHPVYVGISSEVGGPLQPYDNNLLFWSETDGSGAVAHLLARTYSPSIHRFQGGFIAPDRDSLVALNSDLQIRQRYVLSGLGAGTQSMATTSPDASVAVYEFNETGRGEGNAARLAVVDGHGLRETMTTVRPDAVAACDDGTVKWIEHHPDGGELGKPGTADLAVWSVGEEIVRKPIDWRFQLIGDGNQLECSGQYPVVATDESDTRVSAVFHENTDSVAVSGIRKFPDIEFAKMGRFHTVHNRTFYSLSESGRLFAVNLDRNELLYEHELNLPGSGEISVTYDGDFAHIVTRPPEFDYRQSVVSVELSNPTCQSDAVSLAAYDDISAEAKLKRLGASYMGVLSVYPRQPLDSLGCS